MFGAFEILYLFLGGTGAGLCFCASVLGLLSPGEQISEQRLSSRGRVRRITAMGPLYRPLIAPASAISAAVLAVGCLCLVLALGKPERALSVLLALVSPIPGGFSWANFGAVTLVVCMLAGAVQALVAGNFLRVPLRAYRVIGAVSIAASLATALYTGFLLSSMSGVAFWRSPFLPPLFLLSSLSCGLGALFIVMVAFRLADRFSAVVDNMLRVDLAVVLAELVVLACFLLVRPEQGEGAASAALAVQSLLVGSCSLEFWTLFVIPGILLPLGVEIANRFMRVNRMGFVMVVLGFAVLTGGAALRYCVVVAAAHPFLGAALEIVM